MFRSVFCLLRVSDRQLFRVRLWYQHVLFPFGNTFSFLFAFSRVGIINVSSFCVISNAFCVELAISCGSVEKWTQTELRYQPHVSLTAQELYFIVFDLIFKLLTEVSLSASVWLWVCGESKWLQNNLFSLKRRWRTSQAGSGWGKMRRPKSPNV